MLISEQRMYALIKEYVPDKYWEKPEGPIRSFMLVGPDVLRRLVKSIGLSNDNVQGLCLDVAELVLRKEKDHFTIFISNEILVEEHMVFVLLHEVGHVDWHFNEDSKKFAEEETELYADFYAYDKISDHLGMDRAIGILCKYCSKDGFAKEALKHDE